MSSVKSLVKKAKKGDGEAFVSLVKQYENVLFKTANRLLNNDEDVADAMQDTILSAYERLHTLKNDHYFHTWMYKILINKCNSLLNRRNKVTSFDEHMAHGRADSHFTSIELEDALDSLPPDTKTALVLYYIAGLNNREIGEVLDVPAGTIKSRISRGKQMLRSTYYKSEGAVVNESRR
ncbi:sigma-70 family RNA polymerase sigma factor [Lederbergia citrisecunda]|uniref:RNA polymerase sigma factor n=2 Tax=Bacillales TaxID=1385 RepID=UPI003D2BAF13